MSDQSSVYVCINCSFCNSKEGEAAHHVNMNGHEVKEYRKDIHGNIHYVKTLRPIYVSPYGGRGDRVE